METEISGLLERPSSMSMFDLQTKKNIDKQRAQKVADASQVIYLSASQNSFLSHLKYRLHHGYSFLDFSTLANLSATSRIMRLKCNEIWKAFVGSPIFISRPIDLYLPEGRDLSWLYSQSLSNSSSGWLPMGLINVLQSIDAKPLRDSFFNAVKKGHLKTFTTLIEWGMDIKLRDDSGQTTLILAAKYVQPKITQYIINFLKKENKKMGAIDIQSFLNMRDSNNQTAWRIAKQKVYDAIYNNNPYGIDKCLLNANQFICMFKKTKRTGWNLLFKAVACDDYITSVMSSLCCRSKRTPLNDPKEVSGAFLCFHCSCCCCCWCCVCRCCCEKY